MVFSDLFFIFCFIPMFGVLYWLCGLFDKSRDARAALEETSLKRPMLWRNIVLTVFSILFYAWGEPVYVSLMLAVVLANFICGMLIDRYEGKGARKFWLTVGVAADLAALGSFKYLGFFSGIAGRPDLTSPIRR